MSTKTNTIDETNAAMEEDSILYDGSLQFTEASIREAVAAGQILNVRGRPSPLSSPKVSLGRPVWWNLTDLAAAKGTPLPSEFALLKPVAEFFLVRLACSFRTGYGDNHIAWARLDAHLKGSDNNEIKPRIFDMYPAKINHQSKVNRQIGITPNLRFAEIAEGSLGGWVTTVEYNKLIPIIIGSGVLENTATWEFRPQKEHPVLGSWVLHLIVERPKPLNVIDLIISLDAVVETKAGLLQARIKQYDEDYVRTQICDDQRVEFSSI